MADRVAERADGLVLVPRESDGNEILGVEAGLGLGLQGRVLLAPGAAKMPPRGADHILQGLAEVRVVSHDRSLGRGLAPAALVPHPGAHLARYHGVFAPNFKHGYHIAPKRMLIQPPANPVRFHVTP